MGDLVLRINKFTHDIQTLRLPSLFCLFLESNLVSFNILPFFEILFDNIFDR